MNNIIDYFRKKRQDTMMTQTIKNMQSDFYQSCHGDFAYYPDAVYEQGLCDDKLHISWDYAA